MPLLKIKCSISGKKSFVSASTLEELTSKGKYYSIYFICFFIELLWQIDNFLFCFNNSAVIKFSLKDEHNLDQKWYTEDGFEIDDDELLKSDEISSSIICLGNGKSEKVKEEEILQIEKAESRDCKEIGKIDPEQQKTCNVEECLIKSMLKLYVFH